MFAIYIYIYIDSQIRSNDEDYEEYLKQKSAIQVERKKSVIVELKTELQKLKPDQQYEQPAQPQRRVLDTLPAAAQQVYLPQPQSQTQPQSYDQLTNTDQQQQHTPDYNSNTTSDINNNKINYDNSNNRNSTLTIPVVAAPRLSEAHTGQIVEYMNVCNLFSEQTGDLAIDPNDLGKRNSQLI